MTSRIVTILLACLLVLVPAVASAKRRVVVLEFKGPGGERAGEAVAKVIKKKHALVSADKYAEVKKRLKAKKETDKNVAKIASELQVDAIVGGVMKKRSGKFKLELTVREGSTGKVIKTLTLKLRSPRVDSRAQGELKKKLLATIERSDGPSASVDEEGGADEASEGGDDEDTSDAPAVATAPPPRTKPGKARPGSTPVPTSSAPTETTPVVDDEPVPGVDDPNKPVAQVSETDDGAGAAATGGSSQASDDEGSSIRASMGEGDEGSATRRDTRNSMAEVDLGVSFIGRKLAFTYQTGLDNKPFGYSGSPVPGGTVAGALYPMGHAGGFLGGLGVAFLYDRVFVLKSRLMASTQEYTTTQTRLGADLRYRWNTGNRPTLPTVIFSVGYGRMGFEIDSGTAEIDLPDVSYGFGHAGADLRLPLGTPKLALLLGARYLSILDSGEIADDDQYGKGITRGVDTDAALAVTPLSWLQIKAGARYTRVAHDFDGTGTKTVDRDGDPDQDVGGALDEFYGGYVTAGTTF